MYREVCPRHKVTKEELINMYNNQDDYLSTIILHMNYLELKSLLIDLATDDTIDVDFMDYIYSIVDVYDRKGEIYGKD